MKKFTAYVGIEYGKNGKIEESDAKIALEKTMGKLCAIFGGATTYEAVGIWNSFKERTIVIEVMTENGSFCDFKTVLIQAKDELQQNCVLLTEEKVNGEVL